MGKWLTDQKYKSSIREFKSDKHSVICCLCNKIIDLGKMGEYALNSHMKSKKHIQCTPATTTPIAAAFKSAPKTSVDPIHGICSASELTIPLPTDDPQSGSTQMVSGMTDAAGGNMVDDGQRYDVIIQRNRPSVKIVVDRLESIFKTSGIFFTLDLDNVVRIDRNGFVWYRVISQTDQVVEDVMRNDHTNCTEEQYTRSTSCCISKSWLCDGDCQNGQDESSKVGCDPVVCFHDKFMCANNQCIDKEYYCDKDDDCSDGSDERDCGINECITIKHACSQKCKDKKIGYECSCEKGFKLDMDQTSCIDIDECSTTYPCDQYCYDLHGSYYCGCAEHNELLSHKHHCHLTNEVEIESSTQSFMDGLWHGFCMYIDAATVNVKVDRNNKASLHALAIQSTSDYFIGHSDLPVETWIRHNSMRLITVNGYQAPDYYIGKMHYETDLSGLTEAIERKSCGNVTTLD